MSDVTRIKIGLFALSLLLMLAGSAIGGQAGQWNWGAGLTFLGGAVCGIAIVSHRIRSLQ